MCKPNHSKALETMRIAQLLLRIGKAKQFYLPLLTTMLMTMTTPSNSAERKTYTIMGARTCKTWTIERKRAASGSGIDILSEVGGNAWLLGYLSALNFPLKEKDVLGAVDADTVFLWTDRYCIKNPNNKLSDAALILFIELEKISK